MTRGTVRGRAPQLESIAQYNRIEGAGEVKRSQNLVQVKGRDGLGRLPFTCFADNWINGLFDFHRGTCFFELCLDLFGLLFVDLFFDGGWSIFNQFLGIHQ